MRHLEELWQIPLMAGLMVVHLTTTAGDGREWTRYEFVPEPREITEEWWEEVIFPLTGSGETQNVHTFDDATIVAATNPNFVGLVSEWDG